MATIVPFSALRPRPDLASKIAALPYDVYSRQEAYEKVQGDPYTFLRIDRPETQFPADFDMYAPEVYEKASEMLNEMVQEGYFIREEKPAYYIYELVMDGRSQVGIGACASVDDYEKGIIKKHENTRADKEEDRIHHVDTCNAQTGPIFLAYRRQEEIENLTKRIMQTKAPVYDFTAEDGVSHRLWVVDAPADVAVLRDGFRKVDSIYIADGHHRCASAVRVSQMRRASHPDYTGTEDFNYFLSVLFPDDQLLIMDYNRVVKDLNGLSITSFLKDVERCCTVDAVGPAPFRPTKKGEVGMCLPGGWYKLTFPESFLTGDPVDDLDVSLLQNHILAPILGITDPKTDERIDFVGGIRGLKELEMRVHKDAACAFSMYPTDIKELFAVSDAHLLMPPKSTWFEPKLRSGLLIHTI